jgi:hypothetical protein
LRFGDVEEAKFHSESRRPTAPTVPVSKETEFILDRLRMLVWPKGASEQLPAVVEQSLKNLRSWYRRMSESKLPQHLESSRRRLLNLIGSYEHYIEEWFRGVWKRYHKWDAWTGDMGPHVWTPYHDTFVSSARGVVGNFKEIESEVAHVTPRRTT